MALAAPGLAQDTTGVGGLRGTVVKESTHSPLAGASVCTKLPSPRCSVTDSQGRFQISGLRPGNLELEVCPPHASAQSVAGVEVRAGVEVAIELTLPTSLAMPAVRQSVEVTASAALVPEPL